MNLTRERDVAAGSQRGLQMEATQRIGWQLKVEGLADG
jgi:hypothetical protein